MNLVEKSEEGQPVREEQSLSSHTTSYDNADDEVWRLLVYEPVHSGWEFINMGGARVLDAIALRLKGQPSPRLLEIGSGLGANCMYLARRFGYEITGIDANPHQVRKSLARVSNFTELRVQFIEHDILTWRPDRDYDCVYTVDSLMLIPQTTAVLSKAYDCLSDRGLLAMTEMMAGPLITQESRKYALEEDEIQLLAVEDYREKLAASGFSDIQVTDLTEIAEECFDCIHRTARRCREQILEVSTRAAYESWLRLSRTYRDGFHARQYEYRMLFAGVRK